VLKQLDIVYWLLRPGRTGEVGRVEQDHTWGDCARAGERRSVGARLARLAGAPVLGAALIAAGLSAAPVAASTKASSAGTISLHETGHLVLKSHHGFTLNEEGTTSGTISGKIYIHLHVVSTNHVTAEVSIYPNGSSLTGQASASYHPSGSNATFSGTMSVVRGTGRYSGAHGSGLSFSGSIKRSNDAVTVSVSGRISS
jgi:hypothetical protein